LNKSTINKHNTSQLISACNPSAHYGMGAFTGRGAPEIDILEAMPGLQNLPPSPIKKPYFSTSLQVLPLLALFVPIFYFKKRRRRNIYHRSSVNFAPRFMYVQSINNYNNNNT
jgi:hypothetical protein